MPSSVESVPPPPSSKISAAPRAARWDLALVSALGMGLLWVGWADGHARLSTRRRPALSFALTARPGGVRVGPSTEFFRSVYDGYVRLENFTALGTEVTRSFRYAWWPVGTMEIVTSKAHGQLDFRFESLLPGLALTIACNGQVVERIVPVPEGEVRRSVSMDLHPGSNLVTFTYARPGRDGPPETSLEEQTIVGIFHALDLRLE